MAIKALNARDIRNQVGFNGLPTDATGAGALDYLNVRWIRNDMVHTGSTSSPMSNSKALQAAMENASMFDPNPKFQVIIDGYLQDANSFSWNTQQTYLNTALTYTTQNGKKLIQAVEGPNEWGWGDGTTSSQGQGSVLPNGTTDQNQASLLSGGQWNSTIFNGIQQWSQAIATYKSNHSSLFSGVEVISLTCLDFSGQFGYYPSSANIKQYVDYGTFHFYTNTPGSQNGDYSGSASAIGYQGNRMQTGMGGGFDGGNFNLGMVISETGPQATNQGGGWATDGYSEAWSTAHTMLDVFALGGHRVMYYTVTGNANFDFFSSMPSGVGNNGSPKPKATVVRNIMSLMSLGNNYKASSNLSDTSSFTPAYSTTSLSISGPSDTPGSGSSTVGGHSTVVPMPLVCHKSDGSTMIAVWREPSIDPGGNAGTSTVPSAVSTTVNFGSSQSWKLWDPMGSTDGRGMSTATSPGQVSSGTGSSATFNLYGVPLFIELAATTATSAPSAPSVSISSTTSTRATVAWTISVGSTNAPSSFDVQYQKGASTGTWTTQANLADANATSYTFYGLDVGSTYYFRVVAKNSIGSTNSNTPNTTTSAQQSTKTPSVTANVAGQREDNTGVTSRTLSLPSVPTSGNDVVVFFSGFGANGNSSSITAPSGSTVLSGPNNDGSEEVTWAWLMPHSGVTGNSWTFSNFNASDHSGWNVVEVTNYNSYSVNHGNVSTGTTTAKGWTIPSPSFSNAAGLSLLSITYACTISSASIGSVARSDASSVQYHQSALLKTTAGGSESLTVSGATAGTTDSFINLWLYGVTGPNQVTNVTSSNVSSKGATISWDSQGSAASAYRVEISSDSGTNWSQVGSIVPGSSSSINVTTLSASTTYLFRVFAYNDAGVSTASGTTSVTTSATATLSVVQHGYTSVNTATGTMTVTLTNPVTAGNTLWFYWSGQTNSTNSAISFPSGAQNTTRDSATDNAHMAWTTTASDSTSSFTFSGFTDVGSFAVVEIQGVSSIDTPRHDTGLTFSDGTSGSVSVPITASSSTPALGLSGVTFHIAPDSFGTMPSSITLLDKKTGTSATTNQDIEYHKGAILQIPSSVTSGNKSIPYSLGNGVTQEGDAPISVGYQFIGTQTATKPGQVGTVTFSNIGQNSVTATWSAPSGTITSYKVNVSTNSNMT